MKRNPHEHACHSTRRSGKVKGATKYWVCEKVKDWVLENPKVTAKELQRRINDEYKVVVHYKRVYHGKELALTQLFGDWKESFNNLYRLKLEIEQSCPGSFVVIDQDSSFISKEVRAFAESYKIKLLNSSPYYAQANGQAESSNKILNKLVKKKIEENPRR